MRRRRGLRRRTGRGGGLWRSRPAAIRVLRHVHAAHRLGLRAAGQSKSRGGEKMACGHAKAIHAAIAIIIRFSVSETKPSGTLLDPPTQAHLSARLSM